MKILDIFQLKFITACLIITPLIFIHSPVTAKEAVIQDKDCAKGGAGDQYSCFQDKLAEKEAEMDAMIAESVKTYKSMWGPKAVIEGQQRIIESQENWKKYRNSHCTFGYYSMAPAHPASHDAHNTACKLAKTRERISEIRREYLNQRSENER